MLGMFVRYVYVRYVYAPFLRIFREMSVVYVKRRGVTLTPHALLVP